MATVTVRFRDGTPDEEFHEGAVMVTPGVVVVKGRQGSAVIEKMYPLDRVLETEQVDSGLVAAKAIVPPH